MSEVKLQFATTAIVGYCVNKPKLYLNNFKAVKNQQEGETASRCCCVTSSELCVYFRKSLGIVGFMGWDQLLP